MKPFTMTVFGVLVLVALAQLLRVVLGWQVTVNGILIPPWASLTVCAIAATLAAMLRREHRP